MRVIVSQIRHNNFIQWGMNGPFHDTNPWPCDLPSPQNETGEAGTDCVATELWFPLLTAAPHDYFLGMSKPAQMS